MKQKLLKFCTLSLFMAIATALLSPSQCFGQLAPEVGYIHPAGGKAGTVVDVVLAGYDWTPDMQYFFHDPRIQVEIIGPLTEALIPDPPYWFGKKARGSSTPLPREIAARITIPADMPAGPVRWQVANANGASAMGQFIVGHANELVEDKLRAEAAAQGRRVIPLLPELPVVISGRVKRIEEVDRYRFVAAKTGPVTCELFARRLGSPLDGVLEVYNAKGEQLVDIAATDGQDLATTFAVEQGQEYTLHLYDVDFRGERAQVYRLAVTAGPRIASASPSGGRRGTTQEITFTGYGLATGAPILESIAQPVAFPTDAALQQLNYTLTTPHGQTPEFPLILDDVPNLAKPATATEPVVLALPVAVTGTLNAAGLDRYSVTGKTGEIWSIHATGSRILSPVDPSVAVLGPDGKELARNDDVSGSTDAFLLYTLPMDGTYQIAVTDMGNPNVERPRTYRLTLATPVAGFDVSVPEFFNVPSAGMAELVLKVERKGGFVDPISVTVSGLPDGYTVPADLMVPQGAAELKIPVTVSPQAAVKAAPAIISAKGTVNGQEMLKTTRPVLVAGTMIPPFKFDGEGKDDVTKWRRGTTFPAPVNIERNPGFDGEIILVQTAKNDRHRQGIWGPEMPVPPGVSRILYPVYVPEWLETTRTSRIVLNGWTKLPDPQGNIRYVQAKMLTRIGFLPIGALFKMSHEPTEYRLKPGDAIDVTLQFSRSPELREAVLVELILDEEQAGLLAAEPLTVPADQMQAVFHVTSLADKRLEGDYKVKLRATTFQPGKLPVISETSVDVEFVPAP
ncbi:MAG: PPC domain-containing protein [Planctomycetaceae bacterium]